MSGRMVVLAVLLSVALTFGLSTQHGDPDRLPGVALESPFLLDLERAALVGALVAGASIFAIRGWAGYFPSKLSTTGAEYTGRSFFDEVSGSSDEVAAAIDDIRLRQSVMGERSRSEVARIDGDLASVKERLREIQPAVNTDDMLGE